MTTPEMGVPMGSVVAVVGAGPCGLAAAIALTKAGFHPIVFDKGGICASIMAYPVYTTFHSTPERLSIGGMPFAIALEKPTRRDALAYYRSLVAHFGFEVRQYEAVERIERTDRSFVLHSRPRGGETRRTLADAVVVATGCFGTPNRLGVPGEDLPHVTHDYREGHEAFQRHVLVVGGGNSAVESALDLFRSGAHVTLVHMGAHIDDGVKSWIRPDIENRIRRGEIVARWNSRVLGIGPAQAHLDTPEGQLNVPAEHVYLLTGYRPDSSLLVSLGVTVDATTGVPSHDPATMKTNVPGVYLAGVLTAGFKANRVFIENGRDHGDVLAHALVVGSR